MTHARALTKKRLKYFLPRELTRILFLAVLVLLSVVPLFSIFFHLSSADFNYVFRDASFYSALMNSALFSLGAAAIASFLALICAYLLDKASIKGKKILVSFLTLALLVPSLSVGLGIKNLFGTRGFLDLLFGVRLESTGAFPMLLGMVVVIFPSTFLVVYDALRYEDKTIYDAASCLGVNGWKNFFCITLPYLKVPLITAFIAGFSICFSDYGIPMEVAGNIKTLPIYLYEQVMSSFQFGRASIVSMFLLVPAIASFVLDILVKDGSSTEGRAPQLRPGRTFNVAAICILSLICFFLFIPQISFLMMSVFAEFPNDLTLTLSHFSAIFSKRRGVGIGQYIANSLEISLLTGLFGTALAYVIAYFSTRVEGPLSHVLHLLSLSSLALPGMVLGIGYIFVFKDTRGFFYSTMAILVVANVMHFLGSPYLMAKNCLAKINRDYEIVGETIGGSRLGVFFRVLIPNSVGTLLEMFSYFFLNSMITISAVAFLCTYKTQPLAIMITTFDKTGDYTMQAVISTLIFLINIVCKGAFSGLSWLVSKKEEKEKQNMEKLDRYEFDILSFYVTRGKGKYPQRQLADALTISLGTVNHTISALFKKNYLERTVDDAIEITAQGLQALEPYRVRKAILLAAGFGSRLAPVTLDKPKALVEINGVRIIDSMIDALTSKGITNIIVVRGYKKDQFNVLKDKYPFIQFIDNPEFNSTNNISSLVRAIDSIDRCYICDADAFIFNKDIFHTYEFETTHFGIKVVQTDDWCFYKQGKFIKSLVQGGEDCYQVVEISYWDEEASKKLKQYLFKTFNSRGGKDVFWDTAIYKNHSKDMKVTITPCSRGDLAEIDTLADLIAVDPSYKEYPNYEDYC